ncbi:MAG: hypothetical protein J1E81_06230 [Eubacterium sp.]|nr:hypothetical protein [Eubacterium sp.]
MIVLFEKNANGKIEFTNEELEKLLEEAKQEGVREGSKSNYIYTTPSNPSPATPSFPYNPYILPVTCGTPQTISYDTESKLAETKVSLTETETKNGI